MVNKIDIKPAVLDSGTTVSVQILEYVDGSLSEDNTYTFDANEFESLASSSNPYVAILNFGTVHTENINGNTTQLFFDGVVCSPNNAYTLAGLVEADVTAFASGGGSYTFPSNSGNTAYVSSGGNNATAVVGNISKPYLTANAAIAALGTTEGTVIVLSSSTDITITNYNGATMPFSIYINILCPNDLYITGTAAFQTVRVNTLTNVYINTTSFATSESILMNCKTLNIPNTATGTIAYTGTINCENLVIQANALITVNADVLNWTKSASVETIASFTYNQCPPKVLKAKINQSGVGAPSIDFVFKNTYDENMGSSYVGVGEYTVNSAGNNFNADKTQVYFGTSDLVLSAQYTTYMKGTITSGTVGIFAFDGTLSLADSAIKSLDITIETYL